MSFLAITLIFFGALLNILALADIFHELFRPTSNGRLATTLSRLTWKVMKKFKILPLSYAGPIIMILTLTTWVFLVVLGWTLIYYAFMPEGFIYGEGFGASDRHSFVNALYFSLITISTLGYGDIVPSQGFLRLAAPVEGLLGFGLITVVLSRMVSLYAVLARRQALAHTADVIRTVHPDTQKTLKPDDESSILAMLDILLMQVITVRHDMEIFSSTYYFHSRSSQHDLSMNVDYLFDLAQELERQGGKSYLRGKMLKEAIHDLVSYIACAHLGVKNADDLPTEKMLKMWQKDHSG